MTRRVAKKVLAQNADYYWRRTRHGPPLRLVWAAVCSAFARWEIHDMSGIHVNPHNASFTLGVTPYRGVTDARIAGAVLLAKMERRRAIP